MNIYGVKSSKKSLASFVGVGLGFVFILGILLMFGAITALVPALVARLVPFFIVFLIVAFALSAKPVSQIGFNAANLWLLLIGVSFVLIPPYAVFKFGPLPAIDARRVLAGVGLLWLFFVGFSSRHYIYGALFKDSKTTFCVMVVVALTLWKGLSAFWSPSFVGATIEAGWQFLYGPAMFLVTLVVCRDQRSIHYFMRLVVVMTIMAGVFAIGEKVFSRNLMVDLFHKIPFVDASALAMQLPERIREGSFRSQAFFDHPLTLAEFASFGACFGLAMLLWKGEFRWRLLGAGALLMGCIASIASVSRSGLVVSAAALSMVFLVWLLRARNAGGAGQSFVRKFGSFENRVGQVAC